jgi:hypothetical protein
MYSIDITLRNTALPVISVQRKEKEAAEAVYQEVLQAMREANANHLLELTCEKQEDKKIALFSDQITAVVISKQTGSAAGDRVPGFFAAVGKE